MIPNAVGSGSITINNASVRSYADSSEMLEVTQNGIYQINNAGPTPTPTEALSLLTLTSSTAQTYNSSITFTGEKDERILHIYINGLENNVIFPTDTTWEVSNALSLGQNILKIYGKDNVGNQTATVTATVNRHTLGDINGDGDINLTDASLFAVDWDKTVDLTYKLSDMNNDSIIDLTDLSILAKLQE